MEIELRFRWGVFLYLDLLLRNQQITSCISLLRIDEEDYAENDMDQSSGVSLCANSYSRLERLEVESFSVYNPVYVKFYNIIVIYLYLCI